MPIDITRNFTHDIHDSYVTKGALNKYAVSVRRSYSVI